jgi:phosphatidylserine/phosphatidylglycerophosphate/cardiolipin synthase-like enzyme
MHAATPHNNTSLLQPGKTCWKAEHATRAALLVDGEEYFSALRAGMLQARKQILIAGWDFDSRIQLSRTAAERADEGPAPENLAEFLTFLIARRPGLQIHVARWDYHWFYSDDREVGTRARLEAAGVSFHEDDCHPVTGCVHHKLVVIDDALAFCGGIDITHKRWDTCAHNPSDDRRRNIDGLQYMPVHDTQLCVSGPIAQALAQYVRETLPAATTTPTSIELDDDLWPRDVRVEFRDVRIGIARTVPPSATHQAVREIENFYVAAIDNTNHTLYVENQYFTSTRIAQAIVKRCRAQPALEGLLVGMDKPKSAAELHTMGYGRSAFSKLLDAAGVLDRVPLVAAFTGDVTINLHSKLATFDDRWLTVGSANLNRRSMGFDVECNLIIEATTPEHRAQIERIRNRLLAEHLGMTPMEVLEGLRVHGLSQLPDTMHRERRLIRIDPQILESTLGPLLAPIFDPEEPWAPLAAPSISRASQRWPAALLLIGTMALVAAAGEYLHEGTPSHTAVQQLIESFLRS